MNGSLKDKILKLGKNYSDVIDALVPILKNEGVIALPTDTLYGVACLAQSTKGIERIYRIKGRDARKPIAICVGKVNDIFKWGLIPEILGNRNGCGDSTQNNSTNLLTELLPGPVTIVTERTPELNPSLNPGTELVGIRIPDHNFIRDLTNRLGEPLALTSANISSQLSPLCVDDFTALHDKLDAIVDGGTIGMEDGVLSENSRKGSTVFRLLNDGKSFQIIRPGCAYDATTAVLQEKWSLKEVS